MKTILRLLFCALMWSSLAHAAATALPLYEARDAYTPCAAFGEGKFLVAWQSGRTAPGDLRQGLKFHGDIVACRVDAAGKALDAAPFVVCGAPDLQEFPRVAFGGGVFLLVWQDARNGKDWDVYAARVSPDGKLLDGSGILVSGGEHNQAVPRVCWDGKTFAVVWQDMRAGKLYQVIAARVSPDGKVLDPGGIKIASGEFYHCHGPAIAPAGEGRSLILFLGFAPFAGDGHRTPYASFQFLKGGALDGASVAAKKKDDGGPGHGGQPVVLAAGKGSFLAAWKTDSSLGRGFGPDGGSAALFDANGARKEEISLGQLSNQKRIIDPDVAWDGQRYIATWHEFVSQEKRACPADVIFAARLSIGGKFEGQVQRLAGALEAPASAACIASDGAGKVIVAYEQHPKFGDVPIRIDVQVLTEK